MRSSSTSPWGGPKNLPGKLVDEGGYPFPDGNTWSCNDRWGRSGAGGRGERRRRPSLLFFSSTTLAAVSKPPLPSRRTPPPPDVHDDLPDALPVLQVRDRVGASTPNLVGSISTLSSLEEPKELGQVLLNSPRTEENPTIAPFFHSSFSEDPQLARRPRFLRVRTAGGVLRHHPDDDDLLLRRQSVTAAAKTRLRSVRQIDPGRKPSAEPPGAIPRGNPRRGPRSGHEHPSPSPRRTSRRRGARDFVSAPQLPRARARASPKPPSSEHALSWFAPRSARDLFGRDHREVDVVGLFEGDGRGSSMSSASAPASPRHGRASLRSTTAYSENPPNGAAATGCPTAAAAAVSSIGARLAAPAARGAGRRGRRRRRTRTRRRRSIFAAFFARRRPPQGS